MKNVICKKYFECDYLDLKRGEKLCFIDSYCLEDEEILIRDIIELDFDNKLKCYDEQTNFKDYEIFDVSQTDLEIFKECKENIFINKYYIKLNDNDDIQEFLRYIQNDKIISYIKDIYGNGKLTINAIRQISKRVLPQCFTKYSVDNAIKYTDNFYNNDLNYKLNTHFQKIILSISVIGSGIFGILCTIIGSLLWKIILV